MGNTRIPQQTQQVGRRIRLDRVHGRAGKSLDEETRCAPRGMRADKRDRFDRRKCLNQPVGAMILVQLKGPPKIRSEEHTSELQSLMRISYAVFCLKKKKTITTHKHN